MRKAFRVLLLAAAAMVLGPIAVAQAAEGETVRRAEPGYLVDGNGLSLYIYVRDGQGESSCYDVCADNWPPVLVDGEITAGDGVIESLLGTVERTDGTTQLTFAGWPLYNHARDDDPGEIHGHRMGDVFFLITPAGARINEPIEPVLAQEDDADEDVAADEDVLVQGEDIYMANCMACHGAEGQGGAGPALANSNRVSDLSNTITTILRGRPDHGMPPFADVLSDDEIAAVATFVRSSFGNSYGPVSAEQVADRR